MTRYLFENKNEEWLTQKGELTKDPNKAMKVKHEVEATLFLLRKHKEGKYLDFIVTEHEFIDKDTEEIMEGLARIDKESKELRRTFKHPKRFKL